LGVELGLLGPDDVLGADVTQTVLRDVIYTHPNVDTDPADSPRALAKAGRSHG
jgi:hypothetical protein